MSLQTSSGWRRVLHEGIDTRLTLRLYAAVAIVAGLTMTGTGVRGIPDTPQARASLIWILGAAIAAAGFAAVGLGFNDDPVRRRRGLWWFAAGHLLLGLMVWSQWVIYWGEHGLPQALALAPLATGVALFATIAPRWLHETDNSEPTAMQRAQSTYDEHIRQVARREERARLARDLHDAVKQQLFVIQTAAATAQERFDADAGGAREAITHVRTAAREATTEMEALLDELQAAPMENTGLVEAVKKQCEALALRTGAHVTFQPGAMPAAGALRPGAHEGIYRVAQEALANVARHARAGHVTVSMQSTMTKFEMRISDDGAGIAAGPRTGMGIANMQTRAAESGGHLAIASRAPGTEVVLTVPVTHPVIRGAWFSAAAFVLFGLSLAVFYGIRGPSSDLTGQLLFLALFGAWVAIRFVTAFRKAWRDTWQ